MASIDQLKASDGSGNAQVATVQSTRTGGSSTIVVDTVAGINDTFMGSMGTPHTFTDPITSETITVISEATAVDFSGHVDGSNLEIDDIAPGYVDGGSEIGDIVIIRPTTQYGDNLAAVLETAHNDDGSLKDDAVTTDVIADDAVTAPKVVGIDKSNLTTDSNPYKFSVYRNGAWTTANASEGKVAFDTETFDTNNNFTGGTYTAPVAGFYFFATSVRSASVNAYSVIYKNGAANLTGPQVAATNVIGGSVSGLIQLAANDTVEVYHFSSSAVAGATGADKVYFHGFLVSRT